MPTIRLATTGDAEALAAIYRPYCERTVISFEETAPTPGDMATRIAAIGATRPWILLEHGGRVAGYAYASAHHERAAYRWAVSTAVYVDSAQHRRGVGRALYTTLFDLLRHLGYYQATAGVTLPNVASIRLHESFGFVPVGVYRGVGYKLGAWHDVAWYQMALQPAAPRPAEPRPIGALADSPPWRAAVAKGVDQLR